MTDSEKRNKLRLEIWHKQERSCALCGKEGGFSQMVLDHDHKTGKIRGVLHRMCNSLEGGIANAIKRYGGGNPYIVAKVVDFWLTHDPNLPNMPAHPFPEVKEIKRLRREIKKAKRESTKVEKRSKIRDLKQVIKLKYYPEDL